MLPSSLAVTIAITLLGLITVAIFLASWRRGHFDRIEAQSMIPLDDDDFAVARPWETETQRQARVAEFGPLRPAVTPGVWGGAA